LEVVADTGAGPVALGPREGHDGVTVWGHGLCSLRIGQRERRASSSA
jgi:hypothetical protein